MVVYEGMFILDPAKYSRDPGAVSQQIADLITQHGGTVLAARLWDERKLAYPINGHKKGVYWLTYFRMPGAGITPLERQCEINDDIIRKLILKVDPRIADALVQHALAGNEVAAAKRPAGPSGPAGPATPTAPATVAVAE
ncbi:MAG: 30S ribosomal protein S6 [Planctomycetota bacterium]|nr:MAG: 30S ribosomal protein S6 [Planctomycetota bacterium]